MKADKNGCSTCQPGKEQYESFTVRGKKYVQYDYRTETGELFATVAPTLDKCREKRDQWLISNSIS